MEMADAAPMVWHPRTGKQWRAAVILWVLGLSMGYVAAPLLGGAAASTRHVIFAAAGAIVLVPLAMLATANALLRRPVLTATDTEVRLRSVLDERRARWQDLLPFEIVEIRASLFRTVRTARAVRARTDGARRGRRFALPDAFDQPLAEIVAELNRRRAACLGVSHEPSALSIAPVRRRPTAWASLTILVLLATVFAVEAALCRGAAFSTADLVAMGASSHVLFAQGEWWRLVSASALHANLAHILCNGIALIMAGFVLERLVGRVWFVAIYCVSALGGALVSVALNPPATASVGASGAIMGLFAATVALAFRLRAGERTWALARSLRIMVPALIPASSSGGLVVDYGAHFGGALFGGGMALGLLGLWPKDRGFPPLRPAAVAIACIWGLLTVGSFAAVAAHYADYHVELIPQALLPRSQAEMTARAFDLAARYPEDPRAHMFKSIALAARNELPAAETELRAARAGAARLEFIFGRRLEYTMDAGLAAILIDEKRREDAKAVAAEACRAAPADRPLPKVMALLERERLCE